MNRYLLLLLLTACVACDSNTSRHSELFKMKAHVKGKDIVTNLADPTVIELMDTLLIVSNYKAEPLIEVYSISGKLIKKFLSIGKGPFEILATGEIQAMSKEGKFFIDDLFTKKILQFDINDVINNEIPKGSIFYALSEEKKNEFFFDKLLIGKKVVIAESRSPKGRLLLFNQRGEPLHYYLTYPDKEETNPKLSDMSNARLYASAIVANPALTKMAMATYSADMINILDINDTSLDSVWSYRDFYPSGIAVMPMGEELVAVHTNESRSGYLDIAASANRIYVLFSGKKLAEPDYAYGNIIRVFNWDGSRICELTSDKPMRRITVSENDARLYGISLDDYGSPSIAEFDLTNIVYE